MKFARLALRVSVAFFAVALLVVGVVLAPLLWDAWQRGPRPVVASVEASGNLIIERLGIWKAAHGRYPESLEEIGVEARSIGWGGWQYRCSSEGAGFEIVLGDYDRNLFVVWRNQSDPEWHWDT